MENYAKIENAKDLITKEYLEEHGGGATVQYIELSGSDTSEGWHDGGTLTTEQVNILLASELSYIWMNGMHRLDFRYRDNANNLATYASSDAYKTHTIEITLTTKKWRYKHEELATKTELSDKQDKTDNNLETVSKTVVGAINEINGRSKTVDDKTVKLDSEGKIETAIGGYVVEATYSALFENATPTDIANGLYIYAADKTLTANKTYKVALKLGAADIDYDGVVLSKDITLCDGSTVLHSDCIQLPRELTTLEYETYIGHFTFTDVEGNTHTGIGLIFSGTTTPVGLTAADVLTVKERLTAPVVHFMDGRVIPVDDNTIILNNKKKLVAKDIEANYLLSAVASAEKLTIKDKNGAEIVYEPTIIAPMNYGGKVTSWDDLPTTGLTNGLVYIHATEGTQKIYNEKTSSWDGPIAAIITIDSAMSDDSVNPVSNKVVKTYIDNKVDNKTIKVDASQKFSVPIDNETIKVNSSGFIYSVNPIADVDNYTIIKDADGKAVTQIGGHYSPSKTEWILNWSGQIGYGGTQKILPELLVPGETVYMEFYHSYKSLYSNSWKGNVVVNSDGSISQRQLSLDNYSWKDPSYFGVGPSGNAYMGNGNRAPINFTMKIRITRAEKIDYINTKVIHVDGDTIYNDGGTLKAKATDLSAYAKTVDVNAAIATEKTERQETDTGLQEQLEFFWEKLQSGYAAHIEGGYNATNNAAEVILKNSAANEIDRTEIELPFGSYRKAADQDTIDAGKQGKLTAGENITISADNVISATGGGSSIQVKVMPTASAETVGKVVQYIGEDTSDFRHNHFYEGFGGGKGYYWSEVSIQDTPEFDNQTIVKINNLYRTAIGGFNVPGELAFDGSGDAAEGTASLALSGTIGRRLNIGETYALDVTYPDGSMTTEAVLEDSAKGKMFSVDDLEFYIFIDKPSLSNVQIETKNSALAVGNYNVKISTATTKSYIDNSFLKINADTLEVNSEGELNVIGGGGSAEIDNKTIIKDPEDKLSTCVGGGYATLLILDETQKLEKTGPELLFSEVYDSLEVGDVINIDLTEPGGGSSFNEVEITASAGGGVEADLSDFGYKIIFTTNTKLQKTDGSLEAGTYGLNLNKYSLEHIDNTFIAIDGTTIRVNDNGELCAAGGSYEAGNGIEIKNNKISAPFSGHIDYTENDTIYEEQNVTFITNDVYKIKNTVGTLTENLMYSVFSKMFQEEYQVYGRAHTRDLTIRGEARTVLCIYLGIVNDINLYIVQDDLGAGDGIYLVAENCSSQLPFTEDDISTCKNVTENVFYANSHVIPIDDETLTLNKDEKIAAKPVKIDSDTIVRDDNGRLCTSLGGSYAKENETTIFDKAPTKIDDYLWTFDKADHAFEQNKTYDLYYEGTPLYVNLEGQWLTFNHGGNFYAGPGIEIGSTLIVTVDYYGTSTNVMFNESGSTETTIPTIKVVGYSEAVSYIKNKCIDTDYTLSLDPYGRLHANYNNVEFDEKTIRQDIRGRYATAAGGSEIRYASTVAIDETPVFVDGSNKHLAKFSGDVELSVGNIYTVKSPMLGVEEDIYCKEYTFEIEDVGTFTGPGLHTTDLGSANSYVASLEIGGNRNIYFVVVSDYVPYSEAPKIKIETFTRDVTPIHSEFIPISDNFYIDNEFKIKTKKRARLVASNIVVSQTVVDIEQADWDVDGEYKKAVKVPFGGMKDTMVQIDMVVKTDLLKIMGPYCGVDTNELTIYLKNDTTSVNSEIIKAIFEDSEYSEI